MPIYDQLFHNGEIYTVDDCCPEAEALAVKGGRVAAVGSLAKCRAILDKDYENINLEGGTLLPGFIDTHQHPTLIVYFELSLNLSYVRSIAEIQELLRAEAAKVKNSPWILALQLDDLNLQDNGRIDRHVLDVACEHRPVVIVTYDGHRVLANTRAIEEAGLHENTMDPPGGKIVREESGYPSGVFHEKAIALILDLVPIPEMEELQEVAGRVFVNQAACGITSIGAILQTGEEGPAGKNGAFDLPLMQMLLEQIPLSTYGLIITGEISQVEEARQTSMHQLTEPEIGPGRKIGAVKMFCDGTLQSATAYMEEPYESQPGNRGFMINDQEDLYLRMLAAHRAGLQIAIHAIGDAANRTCIELYDRLLKEYPRPNHRHRLEHASVLNESLIQDLARLELVVSSQPVFMHGEKHWIMRQIGAERSNWTYPYRSLVEAGVKFAGSSDAPICSFDVLHALQCCVTREGFVERQALSAAQAIRAYTIDAAYAQFEEDIKGSLTEGKRADMVILSANPVGVRPDQIRSIKVLRTICGGRTVFIANEGSYA